MGLTKDLGALPRVLTVSGSNVGVGNISPIRRLEVASDGVNWISGTFSGTGNTNKVVIGNLTTPTIGGHNSALNAWSDFTISGDNIIFAPFGSEKMRIASNGNVGIGTTSPADKLTVVGPTLGIAVRWTDNTNNTGYLRIRGEAAAIGADDNLIFETAGSERMRLRTDGSLANNGVKTQYASGYSDIASTFYVDFIAYQSTPYKILAGITHWNASYGAYTERIQFNDAYNTISEVVTVNHTSASGGSWSISRPNNYTIRVTHNGGSYPAYGNWWIQVIGN